jgi:hypothetical protein
MLDNFWDITKLEASEYFCIPVTFSTSVHPTTTVPYFPHPKMGCCASIRIIHKRAELSRPAADSRTTLGCLAQLPLRPRYSVEVLDPEIVSRITRFKSRPEAISNPLMTCNTRSKFTLIRLWYCFILMTYISKRTTLQVRLISSPTG